MLNINREPHILRNDYDYLIKRHHYKICTSIIITSRYLKHLGGIPPKNIKLGWWKKTNIKRMVAKK